MLINEIFESIQGEGKYAGVPSVFVRTTGCNLRCVWCDTPNTSWTPEGRNLDLDEIVDRVTGYAARHVVVTGGEPMMASGIEQLCRRLQGVGRFVTIETAGTIWKDVVCDLVSLSPKLSNSTPHDRDGGRWTAKHEAARISVDVIRRLMALGDYQLKFVVERPDDLTEIDDLLAQIGPCAPETVLLMPQGVTREELKSREGWIVTLCRERGFRYCPRLHIELFGHVPGT